MTASFLTYPLDLIRTKLSIRVSGANDKPSMFKTGVQIFREGGVRGLYRGCPATMFVSTFLSVFATFQGFLHKIVT